MTLFASKYRVRNENDLVAALGQPLLAARPLRRETHRGGAARRGGVGGRVGHRDVLW